MPKISATMGSLLLLIASSLLKDAGHPVSDSDLMIFALTGVQIIAAIGVWVGRIKAGGVTWYGVHKE